MVIRLLLLFLLCPLAVGAYAKNSFSGPPESDGPVIVNIGFLLSNINAINEEDETFDFEGVLSLHWQDSRLAFDPSATGYDQLYYQGSYQFSEVFEGWWPQVFLANEAGRFDREGVMLRITPDGNAYYTEEIGAMAKSSLQLARFPFDQQRLIAIFEVLGFDKRQVLLRVNANRTGIWEDAAHKLQIPQWRAPQVSTEIVDYKSIYLDGSDEHLSALNFTIDIKRNPWYTLRLVVLPVMIFVVLSWSVFWMDRASLGDRMDISFIGILTVVAYQVMFSENLPKISYITVLMSFMILSFLMMCASVVVNLRVAALDNSGRSFEGNRMDWHCRYVFPMTYLLATLLVAGSVYVLG